jgi:hypothetical protein
MEKYCFNKKDIYKGMILFVSLIVFFLIALWVTASFPSVRIKNHIKMSTESKVKWAPMGYGYESTKIDYSTDAVIMNNFYNIDSDHPFKSTLLNRLTHESDNIYISSVNDLDLTVQGEAHKSVFYSRYWHGNITVLRPLFFFFDYVGLRGVSVFLFNMLVFLLIICTAKKIGYFAALALALSLVYINLGVIPITLNYLPVFYIMLICSLLVLILDIKKELTYLKIIFVTASLTAFMDLFTVPLVTLGIPLLFIIAKQEKFISEQSFKQILCLLSRFVFCWMLGYGLTWVMKPLLASIFSTDAISEFIDQVRFRINNDPDNLGFIGLRCQSILLNLKTMFTEIYSWQTQFVLAVLLISWFIYRKKGKLSSAFYAYLVIAFIPYLWYFMVANHSFVHSRFTYRTQMITVFGLLLAYKNSVQISNKKMQIK